MSAPLEIQMSKLIEGEALEMKGRISDIAALLDLPYPENWSSLDYHLTALRSGKECLVRGKADTILTRPCERCLEDLPKPIEVDFAHSYECKEIVAIDLTPDMRDDILLGLPIVFRCKLDENEHCLESGKNYREGLESLDDVWKAGTWQALDQLEEK
ncbi:MAG: DUF177 domain-containing protein [Verrucomicrobiota bacterium]